MKFTKMLLCALACVTLLCSCAQKTTSSTNNPTTDRLTSYESTIASLEEEISKLKQEQFISTEESNKRLEELTALIETLRGESGSSSGDSAVKDENENVVTGFKYIVSGNTATITGYDGDELQLVIPASVDGYKVTKIDDGAFEDTSIKSVIISDGVETIGWFAFNGCMSLTSITIPSSVTSIGYSALGVAESSLTIYCHSDSFALSYAKSYGLTYTVI